MLDPEHLGEDAELYALGGLDDVQRARADGHLRACGDCARRVGEAEATLLRLIENDDAVRRPPAETPAIAFAAGRSHAWAWIAAVAAAFVIGLLPWGMTLTNDRAAMRSQRQASQPALAAMLAGHFLHASFQPRAAGAPAAKVLYARRGGWLYVVVAPGRDSLEVAIVRDGRRTTVASIDAGSDVRSAFVSPAPRAEAVELLARGVPIAVAPLAYAAR